MITAPAVLAGVMAACAIITSAYADVDFSNLLLPYFAVAWSVTFVSILIAVFIWFFQLALRGADQPVRIVYARVRDRLSLLLLPTMVFPTFLVTYTATKTAIPFIVGYTWDGFWAAADVIIFGDDAWRITQRWFGPASSFVFEWFYTVAWGLLLIFTSALVTLHATRHTVAIFYSAMLGTWLLGGFVLAYAMSAAGPVFAHLVDASLTTRFAPLQHFLASTLPPNSPISGTQAYLSSAMGSHTAVKGGGISAFPSMHIGAASVYVLAARKTWWLAPALSFWIIIFICSAYFGYHYWIDGLLVVPIAWLCWTTAEAITMRRSGACPSRDNAQEAAAVGSLYQRASVRR